MIRTIVFIEPMGAPTNVFAKFMTIPLLGPVYLGTMLSEAGYEVSILNENILARPVSDEELVAADMLGLSCITATIERGKGIAKRYKELRTLAGKPSRTVLGGIHASMMPLDVVDFFDQVVVGEAESVIFEIASGIRTEKIVRGEPWEDLDRLPVPDYTLVKGHERIKVVPVMTSRGCPFHCNFCSVTAMFGKGYRVQSPARVLAEVSRVKSQKIFFADDHFAADPRRTDQILDLLINSGIKKTWFAQVRTEVTKRADLVAKMRHAGCRVVYVGFESINPSTLLGFAKHQTVEDISRSIRVFKENGISVHGMFMLGSDTDTPDVFPRTSDFCHSSGIDFVQYCILTPLPGTDVYRDFESQGRLLHRTWSYYDALHTVFKPKLMTAMQLQRGMIQCFSDFYTYRAAAIGTLSMAVSTVQTTVKGLFTKTYLPSIRPPLFKLIGRTIVHEWIKGNKPYIEYLNKLPGQAPV